MKVLHINCSDVGSTGKIINDINLSNSSIDYEQRLLTAIFTKNVKRNFLVKKIVYPYENILNIYLESFLGYQYGGAFFSTRRIIKYIKNYGPDIVHLHSINLGMVSIYKLLNFLKKKQICTVVTNHAEFFYTGNCSHSFDCMKWVEGCNHCYSKKDRLNSLIFDRSTQSYQKMKIAFEGFKNINMVSVSPWVYDRAVISGITRRLNHSVILNGVDTNIFRFTNEKKESSRKQVLLVTAYHSNKDFEAKGGGFLAVIAEKLPDVDFTIIAYNGDVFNSNNVSYLGRLDSQEELSRQYNMADLTIVLSKRETFGMSIAESLCCGTPVVGFKSGGGESIALDRYSKFSDFGDINAIVKDIEQMLSCEFDKNEISKCACNKYSAKRMSIEYKEIYESLIDAQKGGWKNDI